MDKKSLCYVIVRFNGVPMCQILLVQLITALLNIDLGIHGSCLISHRRRVLRYLGVVLIVSYKLRCYQML